MGTMVLSGGAADFTPLGRAEIGLFKKPDAPRPDITSTPKLIAVLKTASVVFYTDPASGSMQAGMSGRLLQRADFAGIKGQPIKGLNPCPLLNGRGGIVRFSATKLNQQFKDGELWGNGIRDMAALTWSPADNALYAIQHGRDQTSTDGPAGHGLPFATPAARSHRSPAVSSASSSRMVARSARPPRSG